MGKRVWRSLQSNQVSIANISEIHSEAMEAYFKAFIQKDFMLHHAEELPPRALYNAYKDEVQKFMKTVRQVPINKVPRNSNIITSLVIYKVKANDDGVLKMKARIVPHANKDKDRDTLKTDSSQCPPTGIRILTSIATIMHWTISKIDFVSAFLQIGDAKRDVYAIPPRECRKRSFYWLLLTSAYGLVNSNAKLQENRDHLSSSLGLTQSRFIPQLFYRKVNGNLQLIAVRIVDDVLLAGENSTAQVLINSMKERYRLGRVFNGPGAFLFFGLHIIQDSDMNFMFHGDTKLHAINYFPIDRSCRKR